MKQMNCRFCPTTNGNLHLGHIYVALVNRTVAHKSGGTFTVRFDDNQEIWDMRMGVKKQSAVCGQVIADLLAFGMRPDNVTSQSDDEREMHRIIMHLNGGKLEHPPMVWSDASPEVVGNDIVYCAYNYALTAEKVAYDFMSEINCLIRGEDLITESLLYAHICEKWRLPQPKQIYLPRLLDIEGNELSKTKGFPAVKDMDIERAAGMLRDACLIDRHGTWLPENIKYQPKLWERV